MRRSRVLSRRNSTSGPSRSPCPSEFGCALFCPASASDACCRATVDARNTMLTTVQRQAEDVRQQIRKQHSASIKKGNYKKRDPELEEVRLFRSTTPSGLAADVACAVSRAHEPVPGGGRQGASEHEAERRGQVRGDAQNGARYVLRLAIPDMHRPALLLRPLYIKPRRIYVISKTRSMTLIISLSCSRHARHHLGMHEPSSRVTSSPQ